MTKTIFIAKTDLNTDGRILNQIKILEGSFPNMTLDFILLPDKPVKINPGKNVELHTIDTLFRHNKYLRFFTTVEFVVKSLILLFKLKPEILHAQDSAVVVPVLIYRLIKGKCFKLIYDDHEMPNENARFTSRIFHSIENTLMKRADFVIFANKERMEILKKQNNLKNKYTYFFNLPYFEDENGTLLNNKYLKKLLEIDNFISKDYKFIIHQGPLMVERGREKLADFSKILPANYKIMLLGGNEKDFEKFCKEYDVDKNNFHFIGSVDYEVLHTFWEKGIASIIMYLPTYINNRLCAPNRFYLSLKKGLPVIVNKDNPVLSNFVKQYNCGVFIEDITEFNFFLIDDKKSIKTDIFDKLKKEHIIRLLEIYK